MSIATWLTISAIDILGCLDLGKASSQSQRYDLVGSSVILLVIGPDSRLPYGNRIDTSDRSHALYPKASGGDVQSKDRCVTCVAMGGSSTSEGELNLPCANLSSYEGKQWIPLNINLSFLGLKYIRHTYGQGEKVWKRGQGCWACCI
jgi:hypothetical protein